MEIRTISTDQINAWEAYVEQNPTIAWQSYHWNTVVKRHHPTDFHPLAAVEGSRICGILPLYAVRSIKGDLSLISVPYAVGGGLVADNTEAKKALLGAAIDLHERLGAKRIVFKQYKTKIQADLATDDNFYNRELDLTVGSDNLWSGLAENNRNHIVKAPNTPFRLVYPCSDIKGFYRMLLRHHRNSGIPCVSSRWIQDLIDFKMYSIAILKLNDRIVAGSLVKEHKQTVSFPFTCLPDSSDQSLGFGYNLYWLLIKKFSNEGKAIFHSGRIPKTDETYPYRLGWGGQKHGYFYQYYPNRGAGQTEFKKKVSRKRQLVSSVWRRLPLPIAELLGPAIVRQFP